MKEFFKKSKTIRYIYYKTNNLINASLVKISPILATKFFYRRSIGKKINLNNPKTFNEKISWLKLYWQNPLVVLGADKYEVRKYVKKCGCEEILNELHGVYDEPSEVK